MSDYGLDCDAGQAHYEKTPDETKAIPFEWASRLAGATITTGPTYELPDGLANAATAGSGSSRRVLVSGGTDGCLYRVISKVTGSDGQIHEQVKYVKVIDP